MTAILNSQSRSAFENPQQEKEPSAKDKANMFEQQGKKDKNKEALNHFRVNLNKGRKVNTTGKKNEDFQTRAKSFEQFQGGDEKEKD